jgi:hypothetical protein
VPNQTADSICVRRAARTSPHPHDLLATAWQFRWAAAFALTILVLFTVGFHAPVVHA